jgi:hypothetical protein
MVPFLSLQLLFAMYSMMTVFFALQAFIKYYSYFRLNLALVTDLFELDVMSGSIQASV